jgi:hypothetical protein
VPDTNGDKRGEGGGPTHDPFSVKQFARVDNARSLFQNYLPRAFIASARWNTLELVRARYIDGELRSHYPDLLYKVEIEGQFAFIYVLFEHKSYVAPLAPWQLLRQKVHIWHDWLSQPENANATRLPLILPLVLYHGERGWSAPRNFAELIEIPSALKTELAPHIPAFDHLFVDLHA